MFIKNCIINLIEINITTTAQKLEIYFLSNSEIIRYNFSYNKKSIIPLNFISKIKHTMHNFSHPLFLFLYLCCHSLSMQEYHKLHFTLYFLTVLLIYFIKYQMSLKFKQYHFFRLWRLKFYHILYIYIVAGTKMKQVKKVCFSIYFALIYLHKSLVI